MTASLPLLSILYGSVTGLALGLTGGGGSIFAVPLLVYGLFVPMHEAIGTSLASVGATAFAGFLQRLPRGEVELGTGLLFTVTGMAGAPIGAAVNALIPTPVLLSAFAVLMVIVAVRMWRKAVRSPQDASAVRAVIEPPATDEPGPVCRRDPEGKLRLTSRCALMLSVLGFATGLLSGLFGVGGGFVIVPALVLFSGMGIHRAVATSLMVISLVSASGITSYVISHRPLNLTVTALFSVGGVLGMFAGTVVGRRISGPALQKGFSIAILAVAVFIIVRNAA